LGSRPGRRSWRHSDRSVDSRFDGSVLIGGRFDASQEGLFTKDNKFKHQDGNEGGQAAETGCGYCFEESRQEQQIKTIKVIYRFGRKPSKNALIFEAYEPAKMAPQ
jgi:hypothetical protein